MAESSTDKSEEFSSTYVCVECDTPAEKLYSTFLGSENLRIEHCKNCGEPVDRYTEYDMTLRLLDLLLLSKPAWRHLLFNQQTNSLHWKLAVICMFCDGYMKLVTASAFKDSDKISKVADEEFVFAAAKQVELYVLTLTSSFELLFYLFFVLVFHFLFLYWNQDHRTFRSDSSGLLAISNQCHLITRCLLLSAGGKLLFIPAIVWSQTDSSIYLQMILVYVIICSSLSFSLYVRCSFLQGLIIVICSTILSIIGAQPAGRWLQSLDLY